MKKEIQGFSITMQPLSNQEPSSSGREEEEQLARAVREGSEVAFSLAVQRYENTLRRQAVTYLRNPSAAEDAVQETFLRAFQSRSSLKGERILPWLRRILHNHCMDVLRRRKLECSTMQALIDLSDLPTHQAPSPDFFQVLDGLPPDDRELVFLRVVEKTPYAVLAEIFGLAEGSLRNKVSQLLRQLREKIQRDEV